MEVSYQNADIAVADLLKIARHRNSMSQKDLAVMLDVSQSRISKIESGNAISELIFWAKYLDLTELRFSILLRTINKFETVNE